MPSFGDMQIVIRPNASASKESVLKLLVCLGLLSIAIAMFFLRQGAWLVLPFAGLEFLCVVVAFMMVMRHSGDYELISITEEFVEVERCHLGKLEHAKFQRYWTRVTLRENQSGKCSLWIGSHNKEVEFGRVFMTDLQKSEMARRLRQSLSIMK